MFTPISLERLQRPATVDYTFRYYVFSDFRGGG
jgi:hypothetical protein